MEARRNTRIGVLCVGALAAAVLLAAVSLAACGGTGESSAPPPSPPPPVYTSADNGATVDSSVGERFTVKLDENPTTGYAWDMKIGPGLTLVRDEFVGPSSSPSPLMGAGGTRSWVFRADEAGTLTLTGLYVRPWEDESKSAADFSLTIEAK